MKEIKDRLKNRSDLEKLEQDLVEIERLVDEGAVGEKTKKLARLARRDLESARAAHIKIVLRLTDPLATERQAARQEVEQRIADGETRLFDPQTLRWRPSVELLDEALVYEARLERQTTEIRKTEAQLADFARIPQNLHQLHHLILLATEMLNQGDLSISGQESLTRLREIYEKGCSHHRELTLAIHSGTLKERFDALGEIRNLISHGEMWVLDSPDDIWRPAEEVLAAAEGACGSELARLCDEVIHQADRLAPTNIQAALQDVYLAMDLSIPYVSDDRARLKVKYNELFEIYRQKNGDTGLNQSGEDRVSAEDRTGFIRVRSLYHERMKKLVNETSEGLNQFFRSAITRPVANLLKEAQDEKTTPARTVELIDMAVSLATDALEGSIEIPEAMIRGAVILYKKGITDRAHDLLTSAMPLYTLERTDKIHRHAVTAWLLGCIEYVQGHRLEGYSQWKNAHSLFEDLRVQALKERQIEKAYWYRDRLEEMSVYAIQTFEEIYFQWMNQFDTIVLPESLNNFRNILDRQLGADQVMQLRETLGQYLEDSKNLPGLEENWVCRVDAAFYQYETKDYISALDQLNQAWVGFQSSHRGAVALWLSGLIQWWFPSKLNTAAKNWETSIRIFKELSIDANQKNQIDRHTWYDIQVEWMTSSLKDWLLLTRTR